MQNLSKIDGVANQIVQYRITEWIDENDKTIYYLCNVVKQGRVEPGTFIAKDYEQVFAWLRLVIGGYPGTMRGVS